MITIFETIGVHIRLIGIQPAMNILLDKSLKESIGNINDKYYKIQ
jgi:hypothetical protein